MRRIVATHYPLDPKADTEAQPSTLDAHTWKTRSLRCVSCKGDCPLCGNTCCIYQIARHVIQHTDAHDKAADQARKVIEIVDDLGISACEPCTFSMCSLGGGCGRYVCPDCCGTCPICQDVQCKVSCGRRAALHRDVPSIDSTDCVGLQAKSQRDLRLA